MLAQIKNTMIIMSILVAELLKERMTSLALVSNDYEVEVEDFDGSLDATTVFYFSTSDLTHQISVKMDVSGELKVSAKTSHNQFSYTELVVSDLVLFCLDSSPNIEFPEDFTDQIDMFLESAFEGFAQNDLDSGRFVSNSMNE